MSYRDLKNFTEMMRALGYPRLVSMENFRNPNFPLVAEILQWLVKRYDPNIDIPPELDTDQDRIIFIKSVAQVMATKAHIKLNPKKLYMADGYAVKELLKVTTLLYDAVKSKLAGVDEASESSSFDFSYDVSSKLSNLKLTRQLASEITNRGATLYDLLAKEINLKEARINVLTKQLEITEIEKCLQNSVKNVHEETRKINHMIENVAADEANLEAKIEKRKAELERNQKRLQTLKSVRPAFMDEYERLEEELSQVYQQYVVKFRCLAYIDQQLEELEKIEQEEVEEREHQIRKMVQKMRQEEMLRSDDTAALEDGVIHDGDLDVPSTSDLRGKPNRPLPAASSLRRDPTGRRVFGSMTGGERANLDSDSDLDLEGEDEDASDASTDDDIDLEDLGAVRPPVRKQAIMLDSDNDF